MPEQWFGHLGLIFQAAASVYFISYNLTLNGFYFSFCFHILGHSTRIKFVVSCQNNDSVISGWYCKQLRQFISFHITWHWTDSIFISSSYLVFEPHLLGHNTRIKFVVSCQNNDSVISGWYCKQLLRFISFHITWHWTDSIFILPSYLVFEPHLLGHNTRIKFVASCQNNDSVISGWYYKQLRRFISFHITWHWTDSIFHFAFIL
jgi:hypothetical protein